MPLGLFKDAPADGKNKGPFIATQQLWHLKAPPALRKECLRPDLFRQARHERSAKAAGERDEMPLSKLPEGCRWEPIEDRVAFLKRLDLKRLCILVDAGVGKTTALQQTLCLRSALPGHMAVGLPFSSLPVLPQGFTHADARTHDAFLALLCHAFGDLDTTNSLTLGQVRRLLERKIREKQATILIDALDQTRSATDGGKNPHDMATALASFLASYPDVRCVVSGRPRAVVDRFWGELFSQDPNWEFVQVGVFSASEQQAYVGEANWRMMQNLEADVISVPRMLEAVRDLPAAELDNVRSLSDLYWRAIRHALNQAFWEQEVAAKSRQAEWIFALLAIEMHQDGDGNFVGVDASDFDQFIMKIWQKRPGSGRRFHYTHDNWESLSSKVSEVAKLGDVLDFAVLDDDDQQIFFRDRTMQDFFAALWIARYADEPDRVWLRDHQHQWGNYGKHAQEAERHQFWRLASEMPLAAHTGKDDTWAHAMSVLFLPESPEKAAVRSTEMMFRAWPGLLETAGNLSPSRSATDEKARLYEKAVISELQRDVDRRVAAGKLDFNCSLPIPAQPQAAALHVLEQFLAEFPAIRHGQRKVAGARAARKLAAEFVTNWLKRIPLPRGGTFQMGSPDEEEGHDRGDEDEHPVILSRPFSMNCYATTNALYELFEPGRKATRAKDQYSSQAKQPVIRVDYWDAAVFCWWIGGRLPTEAEWENSCRAGTKSAFHFGNELTAEQANFNNKLGKTTPVGQYPANPFPFQLHDMHGNVWEWCSDWYDENYYAKSPEEDPQGPTAGSSRVVRGGSWGNLALYCRSASRFYFEPAYRGGSIGFRVVCERS